MLSLAMGGTLDADEGQAGLIARFALEHTRRTPFLLGPIPGR
jgi:hypothetical protein